MRAAKRPVVGVPPACGGEAGNQIPPGTNGGAAGVDLMNNLR